MRLLIRTDGDTTIGGGHVMRCLTLAHEAESRGHSVAFVMARTPDSMGQRVRDSGFHVYGITPETSPPLTANEPHHSKWLATSWQGDARATILAASQFQPDWIIWDHYGLNSRWTNAIRQAIPDVQFLAVDDLDDRTLASELVLDQTRISKTRRTNPADAYLTGARFALLRPEFAALRSNALAHRDRSVSRILIAPGMVDGAGLAPLSLSALIPFPEIEVEVVMGSASQTVAEVERLLADRPKSTLSLDSVNMAEQMSRADLCIGAGGMTSWERCSLGLPAVAICTADNQISVLGALENKGALIALSLDQAQDPALFHRALVKAMANIKPMSEAAAGLCDGLGAGRVVDVLEAKLRPLEIADTLTVFNWRNQTRIRNASLDTGELVWQNHKNWMEKTLDKKEGLWMIYSEGSSDIGHINAQPMGNKHDGETWSWGFYIGSENASRGAGQRMLVAFLKMIFQRAEVASIKAEVRADNTQSIALHQRLGFRQIAKNDPNVLEFRLDRCDVKLATGNMQYAKGEIGD